MNNEEMADMMGPEYIMPNQESLERGKELMRHFMDIVKSVPTSLPVRCSECRFWEAHEGQPDAAPASLKEQYRDGPVLVRSVKPRNGTCRRHAPISVWPTTAPEDWCGDGER